VTEDEECRRNYRDYLYEAIGKESRDSLADSVASTILGTDDFVRDIREKYLEGEEERQRPSGPERPVQWPGRGTGLNRGINRGCGRFENMMERDKDLGEEFKRVAENLK